MPSFLELDGESEYDRQRRGTIEIQGDYIARRKPAWLVVGKLTAVLLVVGFGYWLALLHIDYPAWQITAVYFGVLLVYCGIAYLVRPNPDDTNMGWAGGLINDPTQYSDNINRGLRDLECVLQPGQLAIESLLDLLILCGVHPAYEPPDDAECNEYRTITGMPLPPAASPTTGRVLDPDRFDR